MALWDFEGTSDSSGIIFDTDCLPFAVSEIPSTIDRKYLAYAPHILTEASRFHYTDVQWTHNGALRCLRSSSGCPDLCSSF